MSTRQATVLKGSPRPFRRRPPRDLAQPASLGLAPWLGLVAAAGLLLVAFGNNAARLDLGQAQPLFWSGLIVIYAPIALRLVSVSASREERIALSLLLGGSLYVVKVLYEPTGFTLHDELATWRQTSDLILSGQPFADNSLVTGYAGFPGLELLTSAVSQLGALRIFLAGTIVIGLARVALMLAIFLFLERATASSRAAGIGVALYACNPSFLYFDSQFGYESLALVIAGALLLVTLRWTDLPDVASGVNRGGLIVAMMLLAATLVITHHMTSYAMTGFLLLWTLLIPFSELAWDGRGSFRERGYRAALARATWTRGPGLPGAILAFAAVGWFVLEASQVTTAELRSVLTEAVESVVHLITGSSGSKTLFQSGSQTNTTAAKILGVASVVPLLALIPLGLLRTWRRRDRPNALWRALAIVALFYPVTMLLRFTQAGTETSQRASEFVFLGLAFVSGLLLDELPWRGSRTRRLRLGLGLSSLATVIFLGGFIVGESPVTRQPGSFLVGGEARAITPQGVAAAQFASAALPPGSRILVDRPNSTLLASYGHLERVSGSIEGIQVSRVFTSKKFDAIDQRVISNDAIDYIVVDRRLTHEPPAGGFYLESTEPKANTYRKPLDVASLRKFNHVSGLSRIFDNGAIAIYDTSGLR